MNIGLAKFAKKIRMIWVKVLLQLLNVWFCRTDTIQANITQSPLLNLSRARAYYVRAGVALALTNGVERDAKCFAMVFLLRSVNVVAPLKII